MRRHLALLVVACTLPGGAPPLLAAPQWVTIQVRFSDTRGQYFGTSVSGIGDIDGDGFDDYLVGARQIWAEVPGSVTAFSGRTGTVLYRIASQSLWDGLGLSLASIGDVDADAVVDFVAGTTFLDGFAGGVRVVSGRSGETIDLVEAGDDLLAGGLGDAVSGVQDVDGDGVRDFIASAPMSSSDMNPPFGAAYLYSGSTRSQLLRLPTNTSNGNWDGLVADAGDVTGDGRGDILVSVPHNAQCTSGPGGSGFILVFDGATGATLDTLCSQDPAAGWDRGIAGVGDWTGDGVPDFAAQARGPSWGTVWLVSGATREPVRVVAPKVLLEPASSYGTPLAGGGDINGDGAPDLVVGEPWAFASDMDGGDYVGTSGGVTFWSGADDSELFELLGRTRQSDLGKSVARAGDVNGDGREDVLVGAPRYQARFGDPIGAVFVIGYAEVLPARGFVGSEDVIHLDSGFETCIRFEAVGGSYSSDQLVPETVVLRPASAPDFREVAPQSVSSASGDDFDGNGVVEQSACFSKESLRAFFEGIPETNGTKSLWIEAGMLDGSRIKIPLTVRVQEGSPRIARVSPNPTATRGVLTFQTTRDGHARVALFDVSGRRVRTLLDTPSIPAGYHDVPLDVLSWRLPSGVYYYRIETSEQTLSGRWAILR